MLRINNIKMPINHNIDDLKKVAAKKLNISEMEFKKFEITGQAIDARNKNNVHYVYSADILLSDEEKYKNLPDVREIVKQEYIIEKIELNDRKRPVVVGSGPAGIFAALVLAEAGLKPIIIEQGKSVEKRQRDVYNFFKGGKLNKYSNVQFGEGGAGTFSDGKLTTNTNNFRMQKIYSEFILAGAEKKIAYMSKPHVGTDRLIGIMKNIRKKIENLGGEYRFQNKLVSINRNSNKVTGAVVQVIDENKESSEKYEIDTDIIILAIGHSSRDTFYMLDERNIKMERKPFSVGVRIEHKQSVINHAQYGKFADILPPAEYKLNIKSENGRGVYTFCMCPGGVVVPAASEEKRLVVNGMSYSKRNLENANSAVLVNVYPEDFGQGGVLAGVEFQRKLEEKAFKLGGEDYKAPVQLFGDFVKNKKSEKLGSIKPSYAGGYRFANLNECFPDYINKALKEGIKAMDRKIKGFGNEDTVLTAVESRSSSPVKILRNERFFSNIEGIMPCGEGAGYAGGIMSAAVDGIKCAEFAIKYYKSTVR
ncbi:FAD-binding protein [Leptotrichia sp. OH3620_COT-345]|uniref:NAD(P)/FAD-dependent oxidoreductase n=1 Tax=Leptotrichia sp. OH3620_COT-345 TaxID=2491048 RepID=UPI000F65215A|nr:FAD-binding protein [Leptotrichia sp. OH3620_COT-345]RRD39592.1 FAD-binding protein [Leptotrichia sp. OH3620_COT-345]